VYPCKTFDGNVVWNFVYLFPAGSNFLYLFAFTNVMWFTVTQPLRQDRNNIYAQFTG